MSFGLLRDNVNLSNKIAESESKVLTLQSEIKLLHGVIDKLMSNVQVLGVALSEQGPKAIRDRFAVDENGWMSFDLSPRQTKKIAD